MLSSAVNVLVLLINPSLSVDPAPGVSPLRTLSSTLIQRLPLYLNSLLGKKSKRNTKSPSCGAVS